MEVSVHLAYDHMMFICDYFCDFISYLTYAFLGLFPILSSHARVIL